MAQDPQKTLKQLLVPGAGTLVPGAANAITAKIIAQLGFEAAYVTGAGISNSYLGSPDIGLLSFSELVDHVMVMRDAVDLPLIVDGDTGFGNPINVRRTVRLLEQAGANAVQLEDQVFPKRCGHFEGQAVISAEARVQKIKAAVDARRSADFLVIARTDALAANGIDNALERARRYFEAGADLTFVEAPRTLADLELITASLPVPQVVNMVVGGRTPAVELADLQRLGFAMVLYANVALQAAMLATREALAELKRQGSLSAKSTLLVDFTERQRLVDKSFYDALEQRYAHRLADPDWP